MRKASTRLSQYTGAAPPACHLPGCQARMKRRQVLLPGSFFAKNRKRNKVRYVQSMKGLGERVWRGGRCTWRETGKKSRNWRAEVFNCGRITPTNSKKKKRSAFGKFNLKARRSTLLLTAIQAPIHPQEEPCSAVACAQRHPSPGRTNRPLRQRTWPKCGKRTQHKIRCSLSRWLTA